MAIRVAINGFGRIGRMVLRAIIESKRTDIQIIALNDLGPIKSNAHLFKTLKGGLEFFQKQKNKRPSNFPPSKLIDTVSFHKI